jgi:hypothetical protein
VGRRVGRTKPDAFSFLTLPSHLDCLAALLIAAAAHASFGRTKSDTLPAAQPSEGSIRTAATFYAGDFVGLKVIHEDDVTAVERRGQT